MRHALLALTLIGCAASPESPVDAVGAASLDAAGGRLDASRAEGSVDAPSAPAVDVPRLAAPNGRCANARPVAPDATLPAEPLSSGVETPRVCGGDKFAPQPSLWYRLRVPAGQHLAVVLRRPPDSHTDVALRAFRGCDGPCEFGGDILGDGVPSLRWTNPGPDADVLVALSSGILSEPLPTDVTFTVQTPPPNVACDHATPLLDGVPALTQDLGFAQDALPMCPVTSGGVVRAMYYRATVPARQVLTVTTSAQARVVVLSACGATGCLASATPVSGPASASWENAGEAPREVVVAVAQEARALGSVDVTATIGAPATHGRCATPRRLSDGQWRRGARGGAAGDTPPSCAGAPAAGAGRFYAVRVGPGDELSATATPVAGTADGVALRLLDDCAGANCVAGAAWLRYRNEGATARDLLLVAGAAPGRVVTFDLRVRVAPAAYTVTTLPAACDDMRDATPVPVPCCKIFTAPSQPLPFPLRFFGEPVAAWSASNYGYLELWPAAGWTRPSADPVALPSVGLQRVVAPFWNPMRASAMPFVVARTIESPRRHLAVQWTDADLGGSPAQRLTFQAQLFADGTIEFHYCAGSAGAEASGASASIGLQGDVVPRAAPYAFRRAGAVAVGAALRFHP